MKQQCQILVIYFNWIAIVGGLVVFVLRGNYVLAVLWLVLLPLLLWGYVRAFPAISRFIGYGRVDDQPAQEVAQAPKKVTLYTALGCPFCPIVKRRLLVLREEMGFDMEEVDVTLKPDLLRAKGIKAVPVVEVGQQQVVGHATSKQLAELIRNS